jgi:hypothetical protein
MPGSERKSANPASRNMRSCATTGRNLADSWPFDAPDAHPRPGLPNRPLALQGVWGRERSHPIAIVIGMIAVVACLDIEEAAVKWLMSVNTSTSVYRPQPVNRQIAASLVYVLQAIAEDREKATAPIEASERDVIDYRFACCQVL